MVHQWVSDQAPLPRGDFSTLPLCRSQPPSPCPSSRLSRKMEYPNCAPASRNASCRDSSNRIQPVRRWNTASSPMEMPRRWWGKETSREEESCRATGREPGNDRRRSHEPTRERGVAGKKHLGLPAASGARRQRPNTELREAETRPRCFGRRWMIQRSRFVGDVAQWEAWARVRFRPLRIHSLLRAWKEYCLKQNLNQILKISWIIFKSFSFKIQKSYD